MSAKKTVLKLILSKYAPLSIDMQKAIEIDQSDGGKNYPDAPKEGLEVEPIDIDMDIDKALEEANEQINNN